MWLTIARVILRYRAVFIWLILVSTYFMVQKSSDVSLSYSMARLLPKNSDAQLDYNLFVDKFGIKDNVMIIGVNSDNFFDIDNFQHWQSFANNIKSIAGVEEVYSVTDAVGLKKSKQEKMLIVESLFDNVSTQKSLDKTVSELRQLPFYDDRLINDSAMLMLVSLSNDYVTSGKRVKMINTITDVGDIYTSASQKEVKYSGLPYIRTVHSELIRKEVGLFIFLALLVTAIILFFFFRSVKVMMISMVVVGIGVIWSFGTLGILGYEITILTALIPPLLIVIGVPNCIFLINKYQQEIKLHGNQAKSLQRVITKVGNATLMTNVTTASGFATFILTNSKLLKEFGIVASINILTIFLLSLFIIPIVYSYMAVPKYKHLKHLNKQWISRFVNWMERMVKEHRIAIYVMTIILLCTSIIGIYNIKLSGSLIEDMPKDKEFYKDIRFFEKEYEGIMPLEILIDTKRQKGVMKLATLKRMEALQNYIQEIPEFSKPLSVVELVKYSKQAYYNNNPEYYQLPNSQERTFILSYAKSSSKDTNLLASYVDSTGQFARITTFMKDTQTERFDRVEEDLRAEILKIFPEDRYTVSLTGKAFVFEKGTKYLVNNLMISLSLAILLIALFMAWMFRSVKMILVSLIPNLLPLLITAGLMGFLGVPIKPSTILVFSIAFGISVDDTIHFLAKYRQELIANNWKIKKSVYAALRETGVSMFYTSIVLFFGFSVFTISSFGGTVALGALVSATLLFAMLANLLLLPSLLLSLEREIANKETFRKPSMQILPNSEEEVNNEEE